MCSICCGSSPPAIRRLYRPHGVGRNARRTGVAIVGAGSIGLSLLFALLVSAPLLDGRLPRPRLHAEALDVGFRWATFAPGDHLYLDALSLILVSGGDVRQLLNPPVFGWVYRSMTRVTAASSLT